MALCAFPLGESSPAAPSRFEVLQTVFHPFNASAPSHQNLSTRCVLFENFVNDSNAGAAFSRAAAYALLNNTSRGELAYAELDPSSSRFTDYYRGSLVPEAVFDGTGQEYGGTPQSLQQFEGEAGAKSAVAPGVALSAGGAIVLSAGHIDFTVDSPLTLAGYLVTVRAFLVEDHVPLGSGEARFLVRAYLVGQRLNFSAPASFEGRINFTKDAPWVESQLAAIVFVQVDAPPPIDRSPGAPAFDLLGAVVVPLAVLATGATLAYIVARYVRAERRARLR